MHHTVTCTYAYADTHTNIYPFPLPPSPFPFASPSSHTVEILVANGATANGMANVASVAAASMPT